MADAEFDETSIEIDNFHSGLSNEIDNDGDSDVFDWDGDICHNLVHRATQ